MALRARLVASAFGTLLATWMSVGESRAAPIVFFGEDPGPASAASIPNSTAARNAFLSGLAGVGLENLESFSVPSSPAPTLSFGSTGVTGTLNTLVVFDQPAAAAVNLLGTFPISGANFLCCSVNARINFSTPVSAFGMFVTDVGEANNPESLVTPEQLAARPFDTVDGIFRLVTERSPGVFESFGPLHTFPGSNASALFIGVIDGEVPFSNMLFINGTSGLPLANLDGFGYDDLYIGAPVPEPATLLLFGTTVAGLGLARWRQRRRMQQP